MKHLFILMAALFVIIPTNSQTKKQIRKAPAKVVTKKVDTAPKVEETKPEPPSADGKFKCIGDAFKNETNYKQFIVVTATGKNASELKSSIINILSSLFDHPDKVISTVGENIVMVNAYDGTGFTKRETRNGKPSSTSYTYSYSIKIEIKDGKIKINSPSFSNLKATLHYLGQDRFLGTYDEESFYYAMKEANAENKVESLMNSYIDKIVSGLSKNDDW